jgi:Outer membrane protein beta-barrel domain
MFGLYRKKIVLTLLFFMAIASAMAQTEMKFQPDYDAKRIRFGFFLGVTKTHYKIKFSQSYLSNVANKNYFAVTSPTSTGIKAGSLINFHINDYWDVRFSPLSVALYARRLTVNDSVPLKQVDKAWLEMPLLVKYKSERRKNSRMFIFAGVKYGFETNVANKKNQSSINGSFATKTSDFSVDYGMGLEIFREYFKVTPEVHFSHGLRNMVSSSVSKTSYFNHIEKMTNNSVTFIVAF